MNKQTTKHTHCHHHGEISRKSVKMLLLSFIINMMLSVVEIAGGIIAGSTALIGDALHNTCDAMSILIAVVAFKIGYKKASAKYTYGFKRAEVVGGFVNLILLFVSGCYLLVEGVESLIFPKDIDGGLIVWISVLALIVDAATAKISHHGSHDNSNMKMVFVHNLADALGSVGVMVSGLCIICFGVYYVDGIVTLLIAFYMIFQAVVSFPKIVDILMNAAPDDIDMEKVRQTILQVDGVKGVHHIHLWCISEHNAALECHVESCEPSVALKISAILKEAYNIHHCNIQVEEKECGEHCEL